MEVLDQLQTEESMSAIPEKYIEFCRAVAELAKVSGISEISMTFQPDIGNSWQDIGNSWQDEIKMRWAQGRHGEDSRRLFVTSTVQVRANLI